MNNKIFILISTLLLAVASNAQNSEVNLQAPASINQTAEVYVAISGKFLQKKIDRYNIIGGSQLTALQAESWSNFLGFQKCDTQGCSDLATDITGQSIGFNPIGAAAECLKQKCDVTKGFTLKFQLRPGNYAVKLDGKYVYFTLQANQKISIPLVEVYLPEQSAGNIYAAATSATRSQEKINEYKESIFNSYFGNLFLPVSTKFKQTVKSLAEQLPQNANVYIWSFCQRVKAVMSDDSVATRTCNEVEGKAHATKADLEAILFGDDDTSDLFYFHTVSLVSRKESYIWENMDSKLKEMNTVLANAGTYVTRFEKTSLDELSFKYSQSDLAPKNYDLYSWKISEGEARLMLPGQYIVLFQNESGQSMNQQLNLTGQSKQIDLVVR